MSNNDSFSVTSASFQTSHDKMLTIQSHDAACTTHHRDIQPESLKRYSLVVACLVAFVVRCQRGWASAYRMQLNENQTTACQALWDELRRNSSHAVDVASSPDEDWLDYLESCADMSDASDDQMFEDVGSDEEPPPSIGGPSQVSWAFAADTPLQVRILDLLMALYMQLPVGGDNKFYSPILRFVILFSRKGNGQWVSPRRITHFIAILLFCGRLVMMALMHHATLANPQMRYSRCAILTPSI